MRIVAVDKCATMGSVLPGDKVSGDCVMCLCVSVCLCVCLPACALTQDLLELCLGPPRPPSCAEVRRVASKAFREKRILMFVCVSVCLCLCVRARYTCVCSLGCRLPSPMAQTQKLIFPMIRELQKDKSWRVRYMVAHHFCELCDTVSQDIIESGRCCLLQRVCGLVVSVCGRRSACPDGVDAKSQTSSERV